MTTKLAAKMRWHGGAQSKSSRHLLGRLEAHVRKLCELHTAHGAAKRTLLYRKQATRMSDLAVVVAAKYCAMSALAVSVNGVISSFDS